MDSEGEGERSGLEGNRRTGADRALGSRAVAGPHSLALAGLVVAGTPGLAGASHAKVVKVGTANVAHVGTVLTTGTGLTLYWFDKDPAGQATCTGGCAQIYPPYVAANGAHIEGPKGVKGLSLISVGSGHWQVAFDHAPLYRFEGDKKKGQAKAQGAVGLWFVALKSGIKPAAATGACRDVANVDTDDGRTRVAHHPGAHPAPTAPPARHGATAIHAGRTHLHDRDLVDSRPRPPTTTPSHGTADHHHRARRRRRWRSRVLNPVESGRESMGRHSRYRPSAGKMDHDGPWRRSEPVVDAGFKLMNATTEPSSSDGGRYPRTLLGMPAVELHTIGRKTGERRTTMLTSPVHDEGRIVLVASKGGDDRDPQWYRNLMTNPDVEITVAGETKNMRARTASPEEKAALWPDIIATYKGVRQLPEASGPGHPGRHLRATGSPDAPAACSAGPTVPRYDSPNVH